MTLGEKIKQERELRGLTQVKLAAILDVHPSTVQKWEAADEDGLGGPGQQEWLNLCRFFNWPHILIPDSPATTSANRWSRFRGLDLRFPEPVVAI